MAQRCNRLLHSLAAGQRQTDLAIARQITRGGEHQVAQSTQSHEGVRAGAQGQAQSRHLGQTARNQGGPGIKTQIQAVTQTGGNRQHIFNCAPHFHTDQVVIGIDAHGRTVKGGDQRVAHCQMRTGGHQGRRLTASDFHRKAGATEYTRY